MCSTFLAESYDAIFYSLLYFGKLNYHKLDFDNSDDKFVYKVLQRNYIQIISIGLLVFKRMCQIYTICQIRYDVYFLSRCYNYVLANMKF